MELAKPRNRSPKLHSPKQPILVMIFLKAIAIKLPKLVFFYRKDILMRKHILTLFKMDLFWAAQGCKGGGRGQKVPLMKLGAVIS